MKRFSMASLLAVVSIVAVAAFVLPATASAVAPTITRDAGAGNVTGNAGSTTLQIGSVGISCATSTIVANVPGGTTAISGNLNFNIPCTDSFGGSCTVATSVGNWTIKATSVAAGSATGTITTGSATVNCTNCGTITIAAGQVITDGSGGNTGKYTNATTSLLVTATVAYTTATGLCLIVIGASGRSTFTGAWTFSGTSAITVT